MPRVKDMRQTKNRTTEFETKTNTIDFKTKTKYQAIEDRDQDCIFFGRS